MNYIIEIYSDGIFIPVTGYAQLENDTVTLEFGIDDHFNCPDWMSANVYKLEKLPLKHNAKTDIVKEKSQLFLLDAQRDIFTYLEKNNFIAVS